VRFPNFRWLSPSPDAEKTENHARKRLKTALAKNWHINCFWERIDWPARSCGTKREVRMENVQTANEQALDNASTPDTLFGVCLAVGRDFGFNPLFLRLGFLGLCLFSIPASIAAYALLGVGVVASGWLFPVVQADDSALTAEPAPAAETKDREPELLAA
jgi:hypothetical protein